MLDQQLGQETRIQPAGLLKGADGRVFGRQSEVERGVSQRQIEIDQQGALGRFLSQGNCKIASQSGDARAALGAEEYQKLSARLLWPGCRTSSRSPNHRFSHRAGRERKSQKLAGARSHAAHQQIGIGLG